jgi:hypothetical protein
VRPVSSAVSLTTHPIERRACWLATSYELPHPDPQHRRIAAAALCLLNDAFTRGAFLAGAALIDLRLICNRDDNFAAPIEPATRGGAKITRAIAASGEAKRLPV